MSYAYTPGLQIKKATIIRKTRILPVKGKVLVKEGDIVKNETVIAQSHVPGDVITVPLAYRLGILPSDLRKAMLKKEGDIVKKGEVIARTKGFLGLGKSEYKSEIDGSIELISDVTGIVAIREAPRPIKVRAYIPGKVVKVIPDFGAVIETTGAFVQGIFGFGGERWGELMIIAEPDEVVTEKHIGKDCTGKILVGGCSIRGDALKKAESIGVKGIISGGIRSRDVTEFLGYEIGVAITGHEPTNLTCIITEGFGEMKMSRRTYDLLRSLEGELASINGATQIRAGVIRPEIIVPREDVKDEEISLKTEDEHLKFGMTIGTRVRIIRNPHFGKLGKIVGLPPELQKLETESYARVAEVELDDGSRVIVPRANVEIVEE